MAILLRTLLEGIATVDVHTDCLVSGLAQDSRSIRPGFLFMAVPGTDDDGRRYIADAVARGAVAVVAEPSDIRGDHGIPVIWVSDLAARIGMIADRFFGDLSKRLTIVGVTGTNGKTTCAHLLAQALNLGGRRCAVLGTVGNGFPWDLRPATHTTLDAVHLHSILSELVMAGATDVCMEVSSHALDQGRVSGLNFAGAVFTNLTRDHLDYHGTMDAYAHAKARLFEGSSLRYAALNTDDPFGVVLKGRVDAQGVPTLGFGFATGDVRILAAEGTPAGLHVRLATPGGTISVQTRLFGRFNALNLAAVAAALWLDGHMSCARIEEALAAAEPVPGRMERFGGGGRPLVVVDYAHTPDALDKALRALREHVRGRLLCVFGCGGNRDAGKRPEMGRIAEELSDVVVLTDDNPRGESGDAIIADILQGMTLGAGRVNVVRDRKQAIWEALQSAAVGDAILVAGKGHEQYQEIGSQKLPFSDRESVRTLLQAQP